MAKQNYQESEKSMRVLKCLNKPDKILEKHIQRDIMQYLRHKGWVVVKAPTSGIFNKDRQTYIPLGQKGISDLLCCAPGGKFVAIEVKAEGGKLSDHQAVFLDEVRRAGGTAIVAYSLDKVIELVEGKA